MTYFIIPANPTMYNARDAFRNLGTLLWQQGRNKSVKVGDIAFIYESVTSQSIIFKTVVTEINKYDNYIEDEAYVVGNNKFNPPWMELKAVKEYKNPITLKQLRDAGLLGNIQEIRSLSTDIVDKLNL